MSDPCPKCGRPWCRAPRPAEPAIREAVEAGIARYKERLWRDAAIHAAGLGREALGQNAATVQLRSGGEEAAQPESPTETPYRSMPLPVAPPKPSRWERFRAWFRWFVSTHPRLTTIALSWIVLDLQGKIVGCSHIAFQVWSGGAIFTLLAGRWLFR